MFSQLTWKRRISKTAAWTLGCGSLLAGALLFAKPATAANAQICLEAEWGKTSAPVRIYKNGACAGGAAIEIPEGVNPKVKDGEPKPKLSGESVITFKAPVDGAYRIYGRAWWDDGCGNSFALIIDDGRSFGISSGTYKRWTWVHGPIVRLSAGKHTLRIANSEDGVRLDQLFLTTDFGRIPVGKERATKQALIK